MSPIGPYRIWQCFMAEGGIWRWGHAWPIVIPTDFQVEVVDDPFSSRTQPGYLIRNFNHRPDRPHDYRNAEEEFG